MSNCTLIIGESGTGKSSSIRNLDPSATFILNVLGKPLPFKGYKQQYNEENKNYYASDDYNKLISYIGAVNERRPEITTLIIDDFQYVLANEFMRRAVERGFDKFTEIAQHAWGIIKELTLCRDDLDVFVLSHSEADANGRMKCKTIGKMLDDKITLEGMFTLVLHSVIVDGQYKFITQNNGTHLAKSPMGMFEERLIDNDLDYVKEQIKIYFEDTITN